jgi:solute carrier family 25 thiamine pyrophosphate transporter 19
MPTMPSEHASNQEAPRRLSDTPRQAQPHDRPTIPSHASHASLTNPASKGERPAAPAWHNFVAGGVAGAGSRLVTAPLDLIRIRRQLDATTSLVYPSQTMWQSWQTIVQTEEGGYRALFRGNTAALLLWISYAAVQFAVYQPCRDAALQRELPGAAFGAGSAAGVAATLTTYPFDVCRTAFAARGVVANPTTNPPTAAAQHSLLDPVLPRTSSPSLAPRSLWDFSRHLWRTQGISGFYAGAGPAVLQIIPYMGLNFYLYDCLTTRGSTTASVANGKTTGVFHAGTAGAVSGAVSKLVTYPLDTIKRRLMAQAFFGTSVTSQVRPTTSGLPKRSSYFSSNNRVWATVREIHQQGGWRSFYRGVFPSVLKTTLSTALSFSLFRFSKDVLAQLSS